MRKIMMLTSLFLILLLVSGCSLFGKPAIKTEENPMVKLFDYSGMDLEQDTVLVRSRTLNSLRDLLASEGAEVLKTWPEIRWALVSVPAGKNAVAFTEELRRLQGIELATPNLRYELEPESAYGVRSAVPVGELYRDQWGFGNIYAEEGWSVTTGSPDVIVAVIDSGVEIRHPEFAGKTVIGAYNAATGFSDVSDPLGHGTHVAGIAADDGRTGAVAGVAWDSPVMPVKILDDTGMVKSEYVIDAFYYIGTYMRDHGEYRAVANISFGGRGYDFALKDAIDYAIDSGVVVVASAGNSGKRSPNYPAAFNGVISVAASTPYNEPAPFSSRGHWNSVAAPGVQILSTYLDDSYAWMDGTSMAAPFVTGTAALLLAEHPEMTPLQVKNQIEQTATGYGYSDGLGYGTLNVSTVLDDVEPMIYGSLEVQTNILPPTNDDVPFHQGTVTVIDANNLLVDYGLTGEYGNCTFHALRPGSYTVQLTCQEPYDDTYLTDTATVTVGINGLTRITMEVPLVY